MMRWWLKMNDEQEDEPPSFDPVNSAENLEEKIDQEKKMQQRQVKTLALCKAL